MSRQSLKWSRLDNAAKIFPSTSSKQDPKVFRFACELCEPVDPEVLRRALGRTLEKFPPFRSVLRRGLFWYFLEQSDLVPEVSEESSPPCSPLYNPRRRGLLFAVTYYRCRINLEVYHALTDGSGALQFLRALVYDYLLLRHPDAFTHSPSALDFDASRSDREDDSFRKHYVPERKGRGEKTPRAYHMKGALLPGGRIRVVEGSLPVGAAAAKAKELGVSMTVFLTAVLLTAVAGEMPARERSRRPVVAAVPVNLRNYFESESVRNFFGVFTAGYHFQNGWAFDEVLAAVKASFARELTADRLARRMNRLAALEHNPVIRVMPLAVKDPVLRLSGWIAARGETTSLSNLGRITMPSACAPFIRAFDVFISARRLQMCMCSYGDRLMLSLTSPFVSTDVPKRFFRILTGMGLPVEISSNPVSEE